MSDVREKVARAKQIIEVGDQRLLASDGPAGGQPPDITLDEWRELYQCIEAADRALPTEPTREPEQGEKVTWSTQIRGSPPRLQFTIGVQTFTIQVLSEDGQDHLARLRWYQEMLQKALARLRSSPQE